MLIGERHADQNLRGELLNFLGSALTRDAKRGRDRGEVVNRADPARSTPGIASIASNMRFCMVDILSVPQPAMARFAGFSDDLLYGLRFCSAGSGRRSEITWTLMARRDLVLLHDRYANSSEQLPVLLGTEGY